MCARLKDASPRGLGPEAQAAESRDLVATLVAVLVAPAPEDESDEVDDDESEDELLDLREAAEVVFESELPCELSVEWLLLRYRESLRESLL